MLFSTAKHTGLCVYLLHFTYLEYKSCIEHLWGFLSEKITDHNRKYVFAFFLKTSDSNRLRAWWSQEIKKKKKRELVTTTCSFPGTNKSVVLTQALRQRNKRNGTVPDPFAHIGPSSCSFSPQRASEGRQRSRWCPWALKNGIKGNAGSSFHLFLSHI